MTQHPDRRVHFFIRTTPGADVERALPGAVRGAMKQFDQNLPLVQLVSLREFAELSLLPQRIAAAVAGSLGAVALLLSALGVYGVTAFAVATRTREIGIRLALGANHRGVVAMLLRRMLAVTAVAGVIGLAVAIGAAQLLAGLLFGVSAVDPLALGGTLVLLVVTAMAATLVPARRAASIDPVAALRSE